MNEIDFVLTPDDPALIEQQKALIVELQERAKPSKFVGPNNDLSQIRKGYVDTKIVLLMEHLPVTDQTSSLEFWQYVEAIEDKYRRQQPKHVHDATV